MKRGGSMRLLITESSDKRLHHTLKAAYYEGVADAFAIIKASGRL